MNGLVNLKAELKRIGSQLLQPVDYASLSEWADKNRMIGYMSAEPGPWRTDRVPYLRDIMDVAGDYRTRKVVFQAAAQTGKTSTLENLIAFFIAADPCPILVVMPDRATADNFSSAKLEPMISETPALRKLVASKRKRDGGNRKLEKVFPGGAVTLVSAKSAHSLRARTIRLLLLDEVDAYEHSLGEEGDPIKLAEARTTTYPNRKIVMTSTPTVAGFSRIEHEYKLSDQRHFHVPCPLCKKRQVLKWGGQDATFGIKWDGNDPQTAQYQCEHCGGRFDESFKRGMLVAGEWVADNPKSLVPGFHINSLYSPFVTWPELVTEWLEIAPHPDKHQSFFNLKMGEAFEDKTNKIELGDLATHVHDYDAPCPTGVGIITAAADVQDKWIEVAVYGWGDGEECWLLETIQIPGDTGQQEVYDDLRDFLKNTYKTVNGVQVPITFTGIDSGYQTEMVYRQVKKMKAEGIRCFPLKGFYDAREIFSWGRFKSSNKPQLAIVGVNQAKGILHARLRNVLKHGSGYIHFPTGTHADVLSQIISERKVMNFKTQKAEWQKIGNARNEQLDCLVYSYAALLGLGKNILTDLPALVASLNRQPTVVLPSTSGDPQQPTPAPNPVRITRQGIRIRPPTSPLLS